MNTKNRRGIFLPIALAALAVMSFFTPELAAQQEYNRAAIAGGQWYRLITGHLTHFGVSHLVWDVAVLLGLGVVCGLREPRKTCWAIAASMLLIPLTLLWLQPDLMIYRGLSGIDSALFGLLLVLLAKQQKKGFAGVLLLALAAFIAKLGYEIATGHALFVDSQAAGFSPVPLAHLVGLLCGVGVSILPRIELPLRRLAVPAMVVLLTVTQSGCLTNAMWKRGVPTTVQNPRVVSGKTNGAVVIEYGEGGDTSHVLLPIDRTSLDPLRYHGDGRSLIAIEQDVPAGQVRDVKATVLPSASPQRGGKDDKRILNNDARDGVPSEKLGVSVFAFDAAGDPVGDIYRLNSGQSGARFPADSRIFLLPQTQPRDAGPVAGDTFLLVLVTPLTLAVDCFVTPLHWLSGSPLD